MEPESALLHRICFHCRCPASGLTFRCQCPGWQSPMTFPVVASSLYHPSCVATWVISLAPVCSLFCRPQTFNIFLPPSHLIQSYSSSLPQQSNLFKTWPEPPFLMSTLSKVKGSQLRKTSEVIWFNPAPHAWTLQHPSQVCVSYFCLLSQELSLVT